MSSSPSDFMRRMTAASDDRSTSGVVKRGRPAKSASSYNRMHTPLATRPQRPARCCAAAWLMGSTCNCSTLLR
ncbi:hypothetical protein GALL_474670 [mine drainage metagenome]|uniref:Uncharacterized protein n=1 Tax=mine drainage metagenome TaxID=410659 RepID=A0A1J5PHJ3_9ZZZZ